MESKMNDEQSIPKPAVPTPDVAAQQKAVVDTLNRAFKADPAAIYSLMVLNRVPCNQALADDPQVLVDVVPVLGSGHPMATCLGLINGLLAAMGIPLVSIVFSDTPNPDGSRNLLGFCEHIYPAETAESPVKAG